MRSQIVDAVGLVACWRGQLLDLLFPARCVGCGRVGESFCSRCRSLIEFVTPPLCDRCSYPLRYPGEICPHSGTHSKYLDRIHAVGYHKGALREGVHALKYNRRMDLAEPLGELLQQRFRQIDWRPDLIAAVPLHPERLRERGYNQAELLARTLARRVGIPFVDGLRRTRATADQVRLDAAARRENVRGAFEADSSLFKGKRVLLIDDVYTTGATMDACARALKIQGARMIWGLAVTRPR